MEKRKTRVAILTNTLQTFGGGERWVFEVATRLKRDFDVTLLNPVSKKDAIRITKAELSRAYNLKGINQVDFECYGLDMKLSGTGNFIMRFPKLSESSKFRKAIADSDIVYTVTFNPLLVLYALGLSKVYGKRFILGLHNPDFLVEKPNGDGSLGSTKTNGLMQTLFLKQIKEIHAQTETQVELLRKADYRGKVYYIPHFLYFKSGRADVSVYRNEFVSLFAGRLAVGQKGIDMLRSIIETTLGRNNDIKFHIIGSGEDGERIVKRIAEEHKRNVTWYKFVSDKFLKEEYRRASLFIMPSRYETPGLTLLEAQGYGAPAMAFDVPGPKDIMKDRAQGALIEPFNTGRFSKAILDYYSLYKKDKAAYLSIKLKIRKLIQGRYGEKEFISKFASMLKSKSK